MRIWVSGASGLLGREVCRQLAEAGHEVVEADVRGADPVDLLDPEAVARSMRGCEAIVHCAAIPRPDGRAPQHLLHNNVMSTFLALEQAWQAGIRTAVLASSGSIYGTAWSPEPIPNAYAPVDELSPLDYVDEYALSKDVLERTGAMYARRGMQVTALRLHMILTLTEARDYPRQQLTIDDARNLWGYVELSDAARACVLSLAPRDPGQRYAALLIAAADTLVDEPIEELMATWWPQTELRGELRGHHSGFDCSRAAAVIGWQPQASWRTP